LTGMHVWNYVYRSGANGATSTNNGVNAYTLTLYTATNGTGSVIGTFAGNLTRAAWNALNPAQTVNFGVTNIGVRSVVLRVNSSYGGINFSGLNEVAFESAGAGTPIVSFSASTNLVTFGAVAALTWQVGAVTNLVIDNGVGSVLLQTTNGVGSMHIYLLMGQSNMEGYGTPYDSVLDAPQPHVLQFGSRDGMESLWLQAHHPLTSLTAGTATIGMGLEFAKTMLASNADPDVVICLINHALGSTAIQWWASGVVTTKGATHYLYDEAVQRAQAATAFGVIKGVLWHQGEYNSNTGNSNPLPEPDLYAPRVQALVDNLRRDLGAPGLPFVCGKFVPQWTNASGQVFVSPNLQAGGIVEAALDDLPNQRFNTACAANTGLIGREDQTVHYDAVSQRELGRRYALKMLMINLAAALPPQLVCAINGNQLHLGWPSNHTGWSLQTQTNSLDPGPGASWVVVPGSTGTNQMFFPIGDLNGSVFFRLKSP
ncbi:MAG: hypothetical protein NT154_06045, partial [Verrucomicrobia bacterium]|nr:hypothetical protein [Verrucomicrobiota bacterium]